MANSIFRVEKNKDNPYVMLNKYCLNDERLSWKAKGLHCYILSLPDDWQIYESELQTHAKDGRDSLKSAIKELVEAGYIDRDRARDGKGRLKNYEYIVREIPEQKEKTDHNGFSNVGKTNIGKTNVGESVTTNNNFTNKLFNINNNKEFAEIVKVFNQNIHPINGMLEAEVIMNFLENLKVDYRVVIRAIKEAVKSNARNLRYIEKIILDWHSRGLTTLEAVEAHMRDYQDRKNKKGAANNGYRDDVKKESGNSFEGYRPPEGKVSDELAGLTDEELNKLIEEQGI